MNSGMILIVLGFAMTIPAGINVLKWVTREMGRRYGVLSPAEEEERKKARRNYVFFLLCAVGLVCLGTLLL